MKTKEISKLLLNLNSPDRFKLLEDGFIRDKFTGLEWAPSSEETMNLEDAIKYCEKIGCRLPEVQELYSLVNTIKDPCFFPIFKDTKKKTGTGLEQRHFGINQPFGVFRSTTAA